ncbi:MAG: GtrA family protein [Microvirga sp.]|nr:GtrA family protein [Microvirga sp.]
MKRPSPQVVRFLLLGGLAAAVNWGVRFPLSLLMPFPAAVAAAYAIGMTVGFTLYRKYVFPGGGRPIAQQATLFVIVNSVTAAFVMVVAIALVAAPPLEPLPLPVREGLAHGFAIALGATCNFFAHKLLTFVEVAPR